MCMITYVPAGVDVPVKGITNGAIINDDGHGWAVAKGGVLLIGKSMKFDEALDGMLEAREELGSGSLVLFHSRYGTHGEMGPYNIHPFFVGEGEESVMAHNGILPSKYHPHYKDRRSDTRIFVDRIANYVDNPNGVPSRRGAARLGNMITSANKLVFVSVKSGEPKVRIVNAGQGINEEGVWYSNTGFMTSYSWLGMGSGKWRGQQVIGGQRYSGWSNGWDDYIPDEKVSDLTGKEIVLYDAEGKEIDVPDPLPMKCPTCDSPDLDRELGICMQCVTCLDCLDNYSYCLCWKGGSFSEKSWENTAQGKWERENIPTIG